MDEPKVGNPLPATFLYLVWTLSPCPCVHVCAFLCLCLRLCFSLCVAPSLSLDVFSISFYVYVSAFQFSLVF